jgi:hypothetical protein
MASRAHYREQALALVPLLLASGESGAADHCWTIAKKIDRVSAEAWAAMERDLRWALLGALEVLVRAQGEA